MSIKSFHMLQKSKYLVKLEFFPFATEQNEEGSSFSLCTRVAQDLSAFQLKSGLDFNEML